MGKERLFQVYKIFILNVFIGYKIKKKASSINIFTQMPKYKNKDRVEIVKVGFNRCPLVAGRLPMSSTHSMNARKCVHAQKPYPSQAFGHRASKFFEAR